MNAQSVLFDIGQRERIAAMADRPLSVCFDDGTALRTLLQIHAPPDPQIVDVTHNRGRMWQDVPVRPLRVDIDPALHSQGYTDLVADFRKLPLEIASWDVVVFDPPHMTDTNEHTLGHDTQWRSRYGLGAAGPKGVSIAPLFVPFLLEARRILVPGGIVLAKIANMVHSARYQDQARIFKNAAEMVGFSHCDEVLRVSLQRGSLIDPKWKNVWHVRGCHTFWIVLRNGEVCHR